MTTPNRRCGYGILRQLRRDLKKASSTARCRAEAVNPKEPYDSTLPRPYSTHIAKIQTQVERRYAALIITILMALAAVVCVMANLVYEDAFTWSIYVVASLGLLWVLILFPLLTPGLHPAAAVMLDICALLLYLYIVNQPAAARTGIPVSACPRYCSTACLRS
jgi:hypothetical protein